MYLTRIDRQFLLCLKIFLSIAAIIIIFYQYSVIVRQSVIITDHQYTQTEHCLETTRRLIACLRTEDETKLCLCSN